MTQARLEVQHPRPPARPVIKWAGGKSQLLEQFDPYFPTDFNTYHEPFLGGGAVFFHLYNRGLLQGRRACLSDTNPELINVYQVIREQVEELAADLARHRNDPEYYYRLRDREIPADQRVQRASRFIYLNKTCYNGLYRVNQEGKFNVPFGRYKNPRILDEEALWAAHHALQSAELVVAPYSQVLTRAQPGDLIYFDPPYWPLTPTANFTDYTSDPFGERQQEDLAAVFRELAQRNCKVMLSNSAHQRVQQLYQGFTVVPVYASRAINSRPDRRGRIPEYLVLSWAPPGAPAAPAALPIANGDHRAEAESSLNRAWEAVLARVGGQGRDWGWPVLVKARDLKEWTGCKEPRLLTKFDCSTDVPPALADAGLYVLPVSRSEYALLPGAGFHPLIPAARAEPFVPRGGTGLESLAFGSGESRYVDFAYHAGMLSRFLGLDGLQLTIRGRSTTPRFSLRIGGRTVQVNGAQHEIDAGYEGPEAIVLVEAKVGLPPDFNIRQLYYPYRTWRERLPHKPVICVFFVYVPDTGLFHLWQVRFRDLQDFDSIEVVKASSYRVHANGAGGNTPSWEELIREVETTRPRWQENSHIPQADDFFKVASLPMLVAQGQTDAASIARSFAFDPRQASYYRDAAEALGLVRMEGRQQYVLTEAGAAYAAIGDPCRRLVYVARRMLGVPVIHATVQRLLVNRRLRRSEVEEIIRSHSRLSGSTVSRRAKTVLAWLDWLGQTFGFLTVERDRAYLRPVQQRIDL